ncbi:hypothetical protein TNCV_4923971 [Trichonephila clavipes]|nr:hypothetical protein TNCV_4923971 [Trichonephila clavipes]
MPSPGFDPRTCGTAFSVTNHYTGWAAKNCILRIEVTSKFIEPSYSFRYMVARGSNSIQAFVPEETMVAGTKAEGAECKYTFLPIKNVGGSRGYRTFNGDSRSRSARSAIYQRMHRANWTRDIRSAIRVIASRQRKIDTGEFSDIRRVHLKLCKRPTRNSILVDCGHYDV